MNDLQRFQFAGQPTRCIKCGAELRRNYYPGLHRTRVICVNYGQPYGGKMPFAPSGFGEYSGSGVGHELYVWHDGDEGLPAFLSYSVGDSGPGVRAAIYTSGITLVLFLVMFLLAKVGGA